MDKSPIGNEQPITTVSAEWFSPELQVLVMARHADPRLGTSTYQLANTVRTDPDPSLLQVPADYTLHRGPPRASRRGRRGSGRPLAGLKSEFLASSASSAITDH